MRTQFTFYVSFYQAISRIKDPAARASAYDMICAYALYQQEPDLDSVPDSVAVAFDLLRPILDKARAKSENGNKGGSKPEANRKQTESKPNSAESKPENTGSKKEGEKEKEKEKEIEIEVEKEIEAEVEKELQKEGCPAAAPSPSASDPFRPYPFSPALKTKLSSWIAYKRDRREGYTPQQLTALLQTVQQKLTLYPENAILSLIDQCMVAGWKNIIFERLEKPGAVPRTTGPRPLDADETAAIRRMFGGDTNGPL